VPVNNLLSVISGFYDESEIINAKTTLREVASKLTDDPDIPRLKTIVVLVTTGVSLTLRIF